MKCRFGLGKRDMRNDSPFLQISIKLDDNDKYILLNK